MYFQKNAGKHKHSYRFVDAGTGEMICFCGKPEGEEDKKQGGNKYNARRTEYNGLSYQSGFEAEYAEQLDWRKKAKEIFAWERQVKIELKVNDMRIGNYYIDFVVEHSEGGPYEWVEVKGAETELWRMKWRILEATFEDVRRTTDDWLTIVKQKREWKPGWNRKK